MADKVVTDMNQRERERFIAALETINASAAAMITALREEDDTALIGPSMMFMMSILGVQDLFKVLGGAQAVDTSDLDKPFGFTGEES